MGKGFGAKNQQQYEGSYKANLSFFHKLLKVIENNLGSQQVTLKFISLNEDRLDRDFASFLRRWTTTQLSHQPINIGFETARKILNLSNFIANSPAGSIDNNTEIALAGYESVFNYFGRSYFLKRGYSLKQWGMVQYYCGSLYHQRSKGSKTENLERAIAHYTEALQEKSLVKSSLEWASAQYSLGLAYRHRVKGDANENLERAILAYQEALQVFDRDFNPGYWADIQENIGNAYLLRKSDRLENAEKAIACFLATLKVRTYADYPTEWAMSHSNLSWAYLKSFDNDESEQSIEQAIICSTKALQVLTPPGQLSEAQQQHFESKFQQFLDPWGQARSNLGKAYVRRLQGDRVDNIEQAIDCFEEVLSVYTPQFSAERWAENMINLGDALLKRVRKNRVDNIERAIDCFERASTAYTLASCPEEWADALMRLGDAYLMRIKGDWVNNLHQTIDCYQQTLSVYSKENNAKLWARSKHHLGKAYVRYLTSAIIETDESLENNSISVEKTIASFHEALEVFTQESYPQEWGTIQVDLGILYMYFPEVENAQNLERAIAYFEAALQVYSPDRASHRWANVQSNLGAIYLSSTWEDRAEKLELGIDYLNRSLSEYSRSQYPEQWAQIQHNLGFAHSKRSGNQQQNIERAVGYFTFALEIYTTSSFPQNAFKTGEALGEIAFDNQMWDKAIFGYGIAIESLEMIRAWTSTENRRQKVLEGNIDIYRNIVRACINSDRIDKALEYVERSRSKSLVDLMAGNDLYEDREISPELQEFLQQYESLQQQINNLRSQTESNGDRGLLNADNRTRAALELDVAAFANLELQKQEIWQQMRQLDPVLAGGIQVSALNIDQMQQLIDRPTTAILSFFTTDTQTYVFVLRREQTTVHTCLARGTETLQIWLHREWLSPYREKDTQWSDRIGLILAQLAEKLQIDRLIAEHLDGIEELIIVPHLLLHQIPFAAIPIKDNSYFGDRFLLRYIPSCQVLEFCQQRQEIETFAYGTVEDAEENLPCASFEGEQIAQLHKIPREKRLQGSQEATCQNYRQLIEKVQFIHCCHHAESRLDNPLESRLKLADGDITLGQLMSPGWRLPDLCNVFLSCCESGLGEPSLSDDIFTLSTGFLCAGARTVISTLWSVKDLPTALLSIFYYQQLKQGKDCSLALQQAQFQLRQLTVEDITEIATQIRNREKGLIKERKKYLAGSVERLQWEYRYKTYAKMARLIENILNTPEQFPFSSPLYWAAFICQGLRRSYQQ